jgi:hypothetical protein
VNYMALPQPVKYEEIQKEALSARLSSASPPFWSQCCVNAKVAEHPS